MGFDVGENVGLEVGDAVGLSVDASQAGVALLVVRISLGLGGAGVVSYGDSVFSARCSKAAGAPAAATALIRLLSLDEPATQ